MSRLHAEGLIFCLVWAALAWFAGQRAGFYVGTLLSVGLLLILMPVTGLVLSKTGNFALERQLRWSILAAAALALAVWLSF